MSATKTQALLEAAREKLGGVSEPQRNKPAVRGRKPQADGPA